MKFKNLSGTHVGPQSTAKYYFYGINGSPWLLVKPGGEINKPYFKRVLDAGTKDRRKIAKGRIDPDMLKRNRDLDRELYPQYLDGGDMGGWISEETGVEVAYAASEWKDVIEQLDDDYFDELRAFCNDPDSFRDDEEPNADDIADTAKN